MKNQISLANKQQLEVINSQSGDRLLIISKNNKLHINKLPKYNINPSNSSKKFNYNKLKLLRKEYNYSIMDMASMLGICKGYYSLLENGKRRLYYDLAIKIARIFKLNPDDIFLN